MRFTSLSRPLQRGPEPVRNSTPKRRTFLPRLEPLEDRTVPSTLTVLNNLDSGAGSLRYTIGHSRDGDTVVFDPSLAGQTITLTSGVLDVKNSLDIEGPGASLLAISGNDTSRVFDISAGLTVTIAGLTLTHGRAKGNSGGGAIENVGSALTVVNDVFSDNQAVASNANSTPAGGGAISNRNGAVLTVISSSFLGNRAFGSKGISVSMGGGAISNRSGSVLTVSASSFVDNQFIGREGSFGEGGAIWNQAAATITGSTFTSNRAVGGDGGRVTSGTPIVGAANGGAVFNQDGATLTVANSVFTANEAVGGSGGSGGDGLSEYIVGSSSGGAITNGDHSTMVVSGCTFRYNRAVGGSNAVGGASGLGRIGNASGGGVAILFGSVATINDSTFDHNEALGGSGNRGGGGSIIANRGAGGAISNIGVFSSPCTLIVRNLTLINNRAVGGTGAPGGDGGNGLGGGMFSDGRSTLEVYGSTIADNQARGGAAGAGGSAGSGIGGGLYLEAGGSVCLDAFTVAHLLGNHASTSDDDWFGVFTCP